MQYDGEQLHERALELLRPVLAAQGRPAGSYSADEYGLALKRAADELGVNPDKPEAGERPDDGEIVKLAESLAAESGITLATADYEQMTSLYEAAEQRLRTARGNAEVIYAAVQADPELRGRLADVILAHRNVGSDIEKLEAERERFNAERERISGELDRIEAAWSDLRVDAVRLVN